MWPPTESVFSRRLDGALEIAARLDSQAGCRARASLDGLLDIDSWSLAAAHDARFSELTPGGFPVEFNFNFPGGGIHYVCEVGGPALAAGDRLATAQTRLQRLGAAPLDSAVSTELTDVQQLGHLKFGAWAGGRHARGKDRYKIYAEVPRGTNMPIVGPHTTTASRYLQETGVAAQLDMLAVSPGAQEVELYFRMRSFQASTLAPLLRPLQLQSQADQLLHLVESVYGWPVHQSFPGRVHGFSVTVGGQRPPEFTLFVFAEDLFEDSAHTRRAILNLGQERGWETEFYREFSRSLKSESNMKHHGMFGFRIRGGYSPAVYVGLQPMEPPAREPSSPSKQGLAESVTFT